jgi:3-methyladenine DNA glycosylase/8-oxoguanine DNA glycosylase
MSRISPSKNDGLCFDAEKAVQFLSGTDATLARLISVVGPFRMEVRTMQNPFEVLARNIIYQQLNGTAAATIHSHVLGLFAGQRLRPKDILEASEEELRGAGLSRNKLASLKDLAAKALDGTVPTLGRLKSMSDEDIIERLTRVRGIGRWTVEMLLMFRLGRPDVLPVGDYGVRKGFSLAYRTETMPKPKDLANYGERWRPYRTVASWYLWRAHS